MQKIRVKILTGGVCEYDPNSHVFRIIKNENQKERVLFVDQEEQTQEQFDNLLLKFIDVQNRLGKNANVSVGTIIVTNNCNMSCDFCYAHKNSEEDEYEFKIDYIKYLKTILPDSAFNYGVISGGEPFLYPDIVKQIRSEYRKCNILSNGVMIDDEIVKWALATNTSIYVTLDYEMNNFSGHDSNGARISLQNLINKYPEFINNISTGTVMPIDRLDELDTLRSQQVKFESDTWKLFNFIAPDNNKEYSANVSFFEREIDNLEENKISIKESIFFRYINYLQSVFTEGFNTSSCSNSLTLNYRGHIYACQEYASMPAKFSHLRFKPIDVYRFSQEEFLSHVSEYKYGPNSLCKEQNCNMRYLCGGICWANIKHNRYLCEFTKIAIAYALYLKINYIQSNLTLVSTVI